MQGCQSNIWGWGSGEKDGWRKRREDWRSPPGLCIARPPSRANLRCCQQGQKRAGPGHLQPCLTSSAVWWVPCSSDWDEFTQDFEDFFLYCVWFVNVIHNILLGNTSPRAISRAERERKVSMRLHRGAPANVSSSDLTARHDQSRISTSQVKIKIVLWVKRLIILSVTQAFFYFIFRSVCHLSTWGSRVLWLSLFTKLTGKDLFNTSQCCNYATFLWL